MRTHDRALIESATFALMLQSREWLAENAFRRVTLEEAARTAGFSPYHYQRLFVRSFGESPQEFVTARRMEAAKRLLRSGGPTVSEICLEVGYASLGSFSSMFSRREGVSPQEFRRVFTAPGLWALKSTPACFRFRLLN